MEQRVRRIFSHLGTLSCGRYLLPCIYLFLLFAALPARAAAPEETAKLEALVQAFYVPYLQNKADYEPPAPLDVVAVHGTVRLKALIQKEEACETRTREICDIDFDPIIDGQDWDLKGKLPVVTPLAQNSDSLVLSSRFVTCNDAVEVDYHFIRQANDLWVISDVSSPGTEDGPWDLAKILEGAK